MYASSPQPLLECCDDYVFSKVVNPYIHKRFSSFSTITQTSLKNIRIQFDV